MKDGSEQEMNEIVLIEYLDIIHTLFIHSGLISDAKKFITEIEADRNDKNSFMSSMSNLVSSPLPPLSYNGSGSVYNFNVSIFIVQSLSISTNFTISVCDNNNPCFSCVEISIFTLIDKNCHISS